MKKLLSILFLLNIISVYATECSDFIEQQYKNDCNTTVKINVRKEFSQEVSQNIGDNEISSITYGYADMKQKHKRKCRVSYICLMDKNCKPLWGYVIPR